MNAVPKTRIYLENKPTVTRIVPELAVAIGLNESIILLQLDFWIGQSDNLKDGHYWTFQSLRDMREKAFGYLGLATINRAVQSLEEQGLIIVGNHNKRKGDNTRWFALNPDGLKKLAKRVPCLVITNGVIQNETPRIAEASTVIQNETPTDQNGSTLPEITTENQKQKEVVVARPRTPLTLFSEGAIWMLSRTVAARPQPVEAIQPAAEIPPAPVEPPLTPDENRRAELISLYQQLFPTQLTPTVAANLRDALEEFGFDIVRDSMQEAKDSTRGGFVAWTLLDRIMKRRKLEHPAEAFDDPFWVAFKTCWKELTMTDIPDPTTPYLVRRFRETGEALKRMGAEVQDVRALVKAKIDEERYDYRFDYAATDITSFVTRRKAPRSQGANSPAWRALSVPEATPNLSPEERAALVEQGRVRRQQVMRELAAERAETS